MYNFFQHGMSSYFIRECQRITFKPFRNANRIAISYLNQFPDVQNSAVRSARAYTQAYENFFLHHREKPFGITKTSRNDVIYDVKEECVLDETFCRIIHFSTQEEKTIRLHDATQEKTSPLPVMLVFAPLSGHFATLLKDTVRALLPHFDVYITSWKNIREIPLTEGDFDLDTYIDYVQNFCSFLLQHTGKPIHTMAVCQPVVPVLAANALMAEDKNPALPLSNVLLAGPVDTRINPTAVNCFAEQKSIGWLQKSFIDTVPPFFEGVGRLVYPGYLQLFNFMAMNPERHMISYYDMFQALIEGDNYSAEKKRLFYKEYKTVMDLSASFFLQTTKKVFQNFELPERKFHHYSRLVDTNAITNTHFLCLEGENDDICGIGQTKAALDIMDNLADSYKHYRLIKNVGHYGVFNGRKFQEKVLPHIVDFIAKAENARPTSVPSSYRRKSLSRQS